MNKVYKTIHGIQPPAISKWWTAVFIAFMLCLFGVSAKAQTQEHNIIINTKNGGGTTVADKNTAKAGETVTVTATPDEGYLLGNCVVSVREGNPAEILSQNYNWDDGTFTMIFKMPDNDVDVFSEFDKSVDNPDIYKIDMPVGTTKKMTIPSGVMYFRVHNEGGQSIENTGNGTLEVTGPEGVFFSIYNSFGSLGDTGVLTIYDGSTTGANVLSNGLPTPTDKGPSSGINSTGNKVLLTFNPGSTDKSSGFDIIFQVLEPIRGEGTADKPYIIKDSYSWSQFVDIVNSGAANTCAKLATDLDVFVGEDASNLLGSEEHPYTGTFDGQGNRILYNYYTYDDSSINDIGLFRWISGATIENLNVEGGISCSAKNAGGIVAHVANSAKTSTLRKCFSNVQLGPGTNGIWGGLVGKAEGPLSIEDCMTRNNVYLRENTKAEQVGAMVAVAEANTSIKNCYSLRPAYTSYYPISTKLDNITTSNCYCDDGFLQQDKVNVVTSDDITSGKLLTSLQNGRTDGAYWSQRWDTYYARTELFVFNAIDAKQQFGNSANCVYYDTDKRSFYSSSFEIGDDVKFPRIDFKTDQLTNSRSLLEGLNTICLPYSIDLTDKDYKVYQLDKVDEKDNTVIVFREVTDFTVPAIPYLVDCKSDGVDLNAENVDFRGSMEPRSVSVSSGAVSMHGNYDQLDNAALANLGAYILQDDSLWHPVVYGNEASLRPTRAYLNVDEVLSAKPFSMVLGDEETTDISNIKTVDLDGTVKYYDLSGRYIGTTLDGARSGIYVTSKGKKALLKVKR